MNRQKGGLGWVKSVKTWRANLLLAGFLVLIGMTVAHGAPAAPLPSAPRTTARPVAETIHGVELVDPYRWLEDQDSTTTRRWIDRQNGYTRAVLDRMPGREALGRRFGELLKVDVMGSPAKRGSRFFFSRRLAGQDLSVICMREGLTGEIQPLIDPHPLSADHTVSVNLLDISDDGRTLLYAVRKGGEDETVVKLYDVDARKDMAGGLTRGWYAGVSLAGDGKGIYYARYLPQEGGRVYYHALAGGEAKTDGDRYLFGKEYGAEQFVSAGLSEDRRHLMITVAHGYGRKSEIFVKEVAEDGPVRPIVTGIDSEFNGEIVGDTLYAATNWKAPNWRLLAIDLKHPEQGKWREVVPEREGIMLDSFSLAGGRLFARVLRDVVGRVEIYELKKGEAKNAGEIAFSDLGTISGVGGRWQDDDAFFSYESYHVPGTIYHYSVASGEKRVWSRPEIPFKSGNYETRQAWFKSKDGTRVPMFLAHRKGMKAGEARPALLTGYGGFNSAMQPRFSAYAAAWIERGGVYAVVNLRGGSEFGEPWHKAGMLEKKQNVFDDFIGAAQWLIQEGYTTPERLAISGSSNGGLLVGAALTQRPDLFRAVICGYPLLDMVRFHMFMLGRLWVPEYGSAEKPEQFKYLLEYSPYQRVKQGVKYPAVLFVTGDADTRVAPLHARKMAAALQAATASGRPVMIRYETSAGHSGGRPLKKVIEDMTDELGFLLWQTNSE